MTGTAHKQDLSSLLVNVNLDIVVEGDNCLALLGASLSNRERVQDSQIAFQGGTRLAMIYVNLFRDELRAGQR